MPVQAPGPPASKVSTFRFEPAPTLIEKTSVSVAGLIDPDASRGGEPSGLAATRKSFGSDSATYSKAQVELQPSPLMRFPSSHCSPISRLPLPHTAGIAVHAPPLHV